MRIGKLARVGRVGLRSPVKRVGVDLGRKLTGGGVEQLNLVPEALRVWARRVGETRARRVWKLMQRGIQGSLPELCTYDWLESRKIVFQFQASLMGGWMMSGGAVVDFLISGLSANGLYVWRVMGEYWHKGPDVERKDWVQRSRMLRLKVGGVPVVAVVDMWENDVYDRYPEVFRRGEVGIGLRGE